MPNKAILDVDEVDTFEATIQKTSKVQQGKLFDVSNAELRKFKTLSSSSASSQAPPGWLAELSMKQNEKKKLNSLKPIEVSSTKG